MSHIDAGWFPDPAGSNRQRYWDGSRWTDYFLPPAPVDGPTPSVPASDDEPPGRPSQTERSSYNYLQGAAGTPASGMDDLMRDIGQAPSTPNVLHPVAYPGAQPASGAYPVGPGQPELPGDQARTPTYQAGAYHRPEYPDSSGESAFLDGDQRARMNEKWLVVSEDPQDPDRQDNAGAWRTARIAGIVLIVVLMVGLLWGLLAPTASEGATSALMLLLLPRLRGGLFATSGGVTWP